MLSLLYAKHNVFYREGMGGPEKGRLLALKRAILALKRAVCSFSESSRGRMHGVVLTA